MEANPHTVHLKLKTRQTQQSSFNSRFVFQFDICLAILTLRQRDWSVTPRHQKKVELPETDLKCLSCLIADRKKGSLRISCVRSSGSLALKETNFRQPTSNERRRKRRNISNVSVGRGYRLLGDRSGST